MERVLKGRAKTRRKLSLTLRAESRRIEGLKLKRNKKVETRLRAKG